MLRLFLAWRLLRILLPLLLFALAALALTTALRGEPHTPGPEHSSLAHAARGVQLAVKPLISDVRNALTQALTPPAH
jgi:hypothetical protein